MKTSLIEIAKVILGQWFKSIESRLVVILLLCTAACLWWVYIEGTYIVPNSDLITYPGPLYDPTDPWSREWSWHGIIRFITIFFVLPVIIIKVLLSENPVVKKHSTDRFKNVTIESVLFITGFVGAITAMINMANQNPSIQKTGFTLLLIPACMGLAFIYRAVKFRIS